MIDINYIRENPEKVKDIVRRRGKPEKANIDKWLVLDKERRELLNIQNNLNNERNQLAVQGKAGITESIKQQSSALKSQISINEVKLQEITVPWQEILDWIPNIPVDSMPDGEGEPDNIILRAWTPKDGYIKEVEGLKARNYSEKFMPQFPVHADKVDFEPKNHLDLGVKLGIIDKEQAAKVSGTRFTYLIGGLAQLQYALQRFVIDELIRRGFTLIIPPLLVKERALYGTSHFPESRDQIYAIKNDNVEEGNQLFLLGSTETANFAYYMDRVIDEVQLPIKLVAYAPAFRSEAGSWGKDTKGIKRLHQFDKIEMDVVCTPDQSDAIFDELLCVNEWLMQSLQIPYQLAFKCTGDAGYYASSKQIDPEFWLPVQKEFMEMGTDTNATDFQARRLNIKFKDKQGNKAFVHTVNDTGVAMGRMLIAILEHYQQSDGSIKVPEVLKTLMGKDFIS